MFISLLIESVVALYIHTTPIQGLVLILLFIWESEFSVEFFTFADPNYYVLLDTLSNSDEHLLSIFRKGHVCIIFWIGKSK